MVELLTVDNLLALGTLSALEIVLGIDNVVFIAILVGRLEKSQQPGARRLGLALAMFMRIALLLAISWIMMLTEPLFEIEMLGKGFSGRDLILLVGGLFLVAKATYEIHHNVEGDKDEDRPTMKKARFASIIFQIVLLDIVFSLDSVITAVGLAQEVEIMIVAIVLAVLVMMIFAGKISAFIEKHPTLKILALSFLLLIGMVLIADGLGKHIEKGYIYFAMCFSLMVETLNIRSSAKRSHAHNS